MKIREPSLYLVISEEYCSGRSAVEIAGAAIAGGVDMIQMREKNKNREELVALGKKLAGLCADKGVIFIVNDDPSIAKDTGADGVHLGQGDAARYAAKDVREILGEDKIIGISTHSVDEFSRANNSDYDYIAFGPIFRTKTKDYFLGTGDMEEVAKIASRPVFFIGGINLSNIRDVLKRKAKNIALIRGITESEDIVATAGEFKKIINETRMPDRAAIKINGKDEIVDGPASLAKFISDRALVPEHIIIEHNSRIVPRGEWDGIMIKENDKIEIVSFVGGG